MRAYQLPDGTFINLDALIEISPLKRIDCYHKYWWAEGTFQLLSQKATFRLTVSDYNCHVICGSKEEIAQSKRLKKEANKNYLKLIQSWKEEK
jgi:hypothetical protein